MTDACRHPIRESLDAYVNGSLPAESGATVQAHLDSCDSCAAETDALFGLAAAIERHGAEPGTRWRTLGVAIGGLAAAAVLVISVAVVRDRARLASPASTDPVEIRLDLGSGPTRGTEAPPIAILTPATKSLRLTLAPPVQPGARYSVRLWPREASTGTLETPLGERDRMGIATVIIPAESVRAEGLYRLEVREVIAEGIEHSYFYQFEVRLAGLSR